jgi:hypothetical protein
VPGLETKKGMKPFWTVKTVHNWNSLSNHHDGPPPREDYLRFVSPPLFILCDLQTYPPQWMILSGSNVILSGSNSTQTRPLPRNAVSHVARIPNGDTINPVPGIPGLCVRKLQLYQLTRSIFSIYSEQKEADF